MVKLSCPTTLLEFSIFNEKSDVMTDRNWEDVELYPGIKLVI
jgi:hypothetical protein